MDYLFGPIRNFVRSYHEVLETGDPRVKDLPFMASPMPTLFMTAAYLYFIKKIGPQWMENRKPFSFRRLLVVYNFSLVAASAWMFYEMGSLINWGSHSFKCLPVSHDANDPIAQRMISVGWWFLLSKYIEFADTVFFVLRKKTSQVTLLHVVHHSVVPISVWTGLKFAPGGSNAFFPFLNSGVHTVMYLYYGLSALGPHVQPFLWWKKYITSLQLLQFTLAIAHGLRALFQDCEFPRSFLFINLFHGVLWFYLFSSFYRQAYSKKGGKNGGVAVCASTEKGTAEASAVIGQLKITASVHYKGQSSSSSNTKPNRNSSSAPTIPSTSASSPSSSSSTVTQPSMFQEFAKYCVKNLPDMCIPPMDRLLEKDDPTDDEEDGTDTLLDPLSNDCHQYDESSSHHHTKAE